MTARTAATDTLEATLRRLVAEVAPDVEPAAILADVGFRDQFDFDSMDQYNLAVAIHAALGVDIPERDYRALASLRAAVDYVAAAVSRITPGA